jgi:hypothetical protein
MAYIKECSAAGNVKTRCKWEIISHSIYSI